MELEYYTFKTIEQYNKYVKFKLKEKVKITPISVHVRGASYQVFFTKTPT
jgi:hypothetical protein